MKILANITGLIKKTDANLPFGKTIQDETDTQPGTAIVADLMRDLFSNFYRLLELAKITPTDNFDGDDSQYQLIDALKKLPNSMNDIEQVLTLNDTTWSVPLDLSILPNKYVFFARATDDYNSDTSLPAPDYTFKGTGATEYSFTSQDNFTTGQELIIVIDTGGVRAYAVNKQKTRVYKALISQSGTNAPTAIVLENTLGEITFEYDVSGVYKIKSDGLFTFQKTMFFINNMTLPDQGFSMLYSNQNEDEIVLYSISPSSSSFDGGIGLYTPITIEVYP